MAAAAVCLARGIDPDAVGRGADSFAGVAHRLERIADVGRRGVRQRLEGDERREHDRGAALFRDRVHLIAGGRGKQQDFSPLAPLVASAALPST